MIDPPKRTGYCLTYDAELLYDNWRDIGGCSCHTGCTPCSSCHNEGHPISLEENDEAWELDEEVENMARDNITDKSSPPKSKWFNGKYRVTPETSRLLQEAVFKDGGKWSSSGIKFFETDDTYIFVQADGSMTLSSCFGDFQDDFLPEKQPPQPPKYESEYDPDTAQPAGYTAYVVFKQDFTKGALEKGEYGGKAYAYICSREDYTQWVGYRAFDEDVFAEVNVSGVGKKVKVLRIEAKVDPKATKSIVRILPKDVDTNVKESKIETSETYYDSTGKWVVPKEFAGCVLSSTIVNFKPNDFSITKEDVNMSIQRKVVEVQLFDDAKGLPVQDSLVVKFENVLTEDDNDTTIREVIMNNDIKKVLVAHNMKRAKVINQDILERTGNSVALQPVLLKDLRWKVIG